MNFEMLIKKQIFIVALVLATIPLRAQFSYVNQFGGASTNSPLNEVRHIDVDDDGSVYMADYGDNQIKIFDASGKLIRQFGKEGFGNGEFKGSNGIALDGNKNIYVTDYNNNRVQKFDQYGNFLMKFSLTSRSDGATNQPNGITVDKNGNIYVTLIRKQQIEVYSPAGQLIRSVGINSGDLNANGRLLAPQDVAVDNNLNIYVIDGDDHLTKFNNTGGFLMKIRKPGYGAADGQFWNPTGVDVGPDGKIYVSEEWNNRVQVFAANGSFLYKFGSYGTSNTQFDFPIGMELDKDGNIYVADPDNKRVQKFSNTGTYLQTFSNAGGGAPGSLNAPKSIVISGSKALVTDFGNNRIQEYNTSGTFIKSYNAVTTNTQTTIAANVDITADNSGNFYVTTPFYRLVRKFNSTFQGQQTFGAVGQPGFRLEDPYGLARAGNGDVWVADKSSHEIFVFNASGEFVKKLGGFGTGPGSFNSPHDVTADKNRNMYVTDYGNNRIQVFNSSGQFLRQFGSAGSGNGQFNGPAFVAIDDSGNIYVTDQKNNRIQKFDKDGNFLSKIGSRGAGNAQFENPAGITVSGSTVYVVDEGNSRVQVFSQTTPASPGSISGFEFLNASNNATVAGFANVTTNTTVQLSQLPSLLNFKALFTGAVDRVDWNLTRDGNLVQSRSDNTSSFTLYDATFLTPAAGVYVLSATPYNSGVAGNAKSITITITATTQPDFLLSSDVVGSKIITRGTKGTVKVSLNPVNGHSKNVSFTTISTLPAGISVLFNPGTRTGLGTVDMEITVGASSPIGQHTIKVRGTDGTITKEIDVLITVEAPAEGDFALSASANEIITSTSSPGSISLIIDRLNGFTGNITFSDNAPAGITVSYSPSSLTGSQNSSNITLTVGGSATTADTFITFTAKSGSKQKSITVQFKITNEASDKPGYSFVIVPSSLKIQRGTSAKVKLIITRTGGYINDVTVNPTVYGSTFSALPGITMTLSPTKFSGAATEIEATISVANSATVKVYPNSAIFTNGTGLSGTGGIGSSRFDIEVTDTPVPPGIALITSSTQVNVTIGNQTTAKVSTAAIGNFTGSINLSAIDLPVGVTATFSPNPVSVGQQSTITFTAASNAILGTFPFKIRGTGNGVSPFEEGSLYIKVTGSSSTPPPTKSSDADLSTLSVNNGILTPAFSAATTSYTVSLPEGTTTVPNVSATAADANATVSITQATNLTGTAAQRTATVVVTAEDGTTTKTYTVVFSVQSATPDFSLTASSTSLSIPQGAFGTTDISFSPSGGFNGTVALSLDAATPLPTGVTAQFTPASISSGSSTLRLDVAATAAPAGPVTLTVQGVSGGISKTIDISLTITEVTEPDFTLNATPQSIIISQGGGAEINVTITALGGFNQDVDLTANILQAGLSASFSPNFLSGSGEILLTITADEDADLGAGEITITATSGTIVHTVSIALQVEPPPVVVVPANQFSPNGDGIDDTWHIEEIEKAPQMVIMVFDRVGRVVFQTTSYQNDWDGTSNGKQLLPATYYFVVRNERGENVETGSVNLIR